MSEPLPIILVSAVALVDTDGRVLLARRPPGKSMAGLWEFPGGKVEPGERPEATLIRELHEEIGITVTEPCLAPLTFASHAYDNFHLLMPLYICRRWIGDAVAREGQTLAGLWEFPGGKLEPGERPEQTLIRELSEEIGITVSEACLAPLTFASHAYDDFHLLMPLYICRRWDGTVIAREGQTLAWVRANKLRDYPMPPADIPLIPHLIDLLM